MRSKRTFKLTFTTKLRLTSERPFVRNTSLVMAFGITFPIY
ncbi:MAG: hypothetical protein ACTS40_01950 [Candidatus Hodgkinia cicadicola]